MLKKFFVLVVAMMTLLTATVFAADNTSSTYKYISIGYGYGLACPTIPKVVPTEIFFDDRTKKGDVLVFNYAETNEGAFDIKRAWVILVDAFDTNAVPDFNKDSNETIEKYLKDLQSNGYEGTALIEVTKDNKGVFAITAKEIEIDTNGDGKPDEIATADYQNAIVFFRDANGRCMSAQLIGSDDLNESAVNNFRQGLATFHLVDEQSLTSKKVDTDKKSKADKKSAKKNKADKKSKKK